eukprot:655756-Amorphochlora_amoeboformis.AAC.1
MTVRHGVTSRFVTPPRSPFTTGYYPVLPGTTGCDDLQESPESQAPPAICSKRTTILQHAINIYSSNC